MGQDPTEHERAPNLELSCEKPKSQTPVGPNRHSTHIMFRRAPRSSMALFQQRSLFGTTSGSNIPGSPQYRNPKTCVRMLLYLCWCQTCAAGSSSSKCLKTNQESSARQFKPSKNMVNLLPYAAAAAWMIRPRRSQHDTHRITAQEFCTRRTILPHRLRRAVRTATPYKLDGK